MKVQCYLTVNENGSIRVSKGKPGLNWNEVSVGINLQIPNMLFQKPNIEATIVVPEDAAAPPEITADVLENVKEAIESSTGLQIKISAPKVEE